MIKATHRPQSAGGREGDLTLDDPVGVDNVFDSSSRIPDSVPSPLGRFLKGQPLDAPVGESGVTRLAGPVTLKASWGIVAWIGGQWPW